jgi:ribosomal protein S18 acetylase RimI-like enzyme
VEWYSDWRDCVHLCHRDVPVHSRHSIVDRLSKLESVSPYTRPILAARSKAGSAAYLVLHPGSLAAVGGMHLVDSLSSASRSDASILLEDLIECAAVDVEIVQAVVIHGELPDNVEQGQEAVFRGAGLKLEAVLCQLEKRLEPNRLDGVGSDGELLLETSGGELKFVDANAIEEDRLEKLVETTYIDTLDVPELNGIRSTHNTIEGYAACVQSPQLPWWMIQWQGADVGCLFLCQHGVELVELVYIGFIPEARGKRLARDVMEFAHRWAANHGATRVVAAVDSRNEPALKLYSHFGYEQMGLANAWFLAC